MLTHPLIAKELVCEHQLRLTAEADGRRLRRSLKRGRIPSTDTRD